MGARTWELTPSGNRCLWLEHGYLIAFAPTGGQTWRWECHAQHTLYSGDADGERAAKSAALHCYHSHWTEAVAAVTRELENLPWESV